MEPAGDVTAQRGTSLLGVVRCCPGAVQKGRPVGCKHRGKAKCYPRICSSFTAKMKSLSKAMVVSTGSFRSRAQQINVSVWDPLCLLS